MSDHSGSDDEFWGNLDDVIDRPSSPAGPTTPTPFGSRGHKRTATDAGLASDFEENEAAATTPGATPATGMVLRHPNQNLTAAADRFASQKKLRTEQRRELQDFACETLSIQNIKIYGRLLAMEHRLEKIIVSQPSFTITEDLHTNLVSYSKAVFFSSKLAAYRGDAALNHMLAIVKRMGWVPPGLEHNTADWNKVKNTVQDIITQVRGAAKKEIKKSVSDEDHRKHTNIYKLTEKILHGSSCRVTVPVMARVALWRNVFLKHPSEKHYWPKIDERLRQLRKKGTTPDKLARLFKAILRKDRQDHGDDFDYEDVVDESAGASAVQDEVDEGMESAVRNAAAVNPGSFTTPARSSAATPSPE
ncbi:hypothetical protein C2E23DRAFT_863934 [Lenzites betulinus]|nr:hypothetical protein C2E23DRAFT_863934 [Lenzites betulinus]